MMNSEQKEKIKLYKQEWWKKNWWKFLVLAVIYIAGCVIGLIYKQYWVIGIISVGLVVVVLYLNNKKMAYAESKAFEPVAERMEQ